MNARACRLGAVLLLASVVAGCGGGGDGNSNPAPPVVVTPEPQESQFGANFGAAFRAGPNSTPVTPADGDIIPLSLTTDPKSVG